jgi:GntR family transcriptional regulator
MADPLYRQIAEDLRRQIEAGGLAPGAQLPTEPEFREKYHASRNTVRDAIRWLTTRGLVETRPGQGTFVVQKIVPFTTMLTGDPGTGESGLYLRDVRAAHRISAVTSPRVEIQVADDDLAAELRLDAGATVVSRQQQFRIDGTPWSVQTSFYPMDLVQGGAVQLIQAIDISAGTVQYLRESVGIKQAGYRDTITVRAPGETETGFLGLPDDGRISVIEQRRTAYAQDGRPVRLTVSVYPADRNQFSLIVGQVPDRGPEAAPAGDEDTAR